MSAVGVSESATTGEEENFYTSGTSIFTISPLLDEINIQMVGGGGGGEKNGTVDGGAAATNGGASVVKVVQDDDSIRGTYTAAGGPKAGSSGVGGSFAAGEAGDNFVHPGGGAHASFAGTGGAGGAYNTNNPGANGGTGAGGGGMGQGGSGSWAHGGEGGEDGTFYTVTITTAAGTFASTDHLEITVGAGGLGRWTERDGRGGGDGGSGRVRIKGELA